MRYFARFLGDAACNYMPFGGIYLMSTVVYASQFMIEEGSAGRELFIKNFQEGRGAGMATYLSKIPIYIVKAEEELAYRGCIKYALQN